MTDLDCRTVADHASAFVDGELDADAWRRIAVHLVGCEGCRRYVDQVGATVRMLGAIRGASFTSG
ncbi:MAG TPA: zf-HC2 domain-containing protein [Acidimicrobiales bacterium]|nr:zf-HC2 domain-containing protein [Acidimicrobiales bacterium]